ncbi:hypothetical protein AVEN_23744-2 [Araneus ventricosus]|uniref:Uncharacterized protein n=1 Tax=Araneus ventricosus TaxID=182803 RepID=A0A4Y2LI25_ARAVE|nr:hypothetical protein AVEN_23744-2 [Araneus ventricosus]
MFCSWSTFCSLHISSLGLLYHFKPPSRHLCKKKSRVFKLSIQTWFKLFEKALVKDSSFLSRTEYSITHNSSFLQLFAFGTPEKLEEFMNRKVSYRHPPTMEYRNLTLSIIGHFRVRDRPSLPGHKSTLGLSNKIEDFLQSSPEFLSISRILKMGTSKIAIASNSL